MARWRCHGEPNREVATSVVLTGSGGSERGSSDVVPTSCEPLELRRPVTRVTTLRLS